MAKGEFISDIAVVLERLNKMITERLLTRHADPFYISTVRDRIWTPGGYFSTGYYTDGNNDFDRLMPNKNRVDKMIRVLKQDGYLVWTGSRFEASREWWENYTQGIKPVPCIDADREGWRSVPGKHLSGYELRHFMELGYGDYVARNMLDKLVVIPVEYKYSYDDRKKGTVVKTMNKDIYGTSDIFNDDISRDEMFAMFKGETDRYLTRGTNNTVIDTHNLQQYFSKFCADFHGAVHADNYFIREPRTAYSDNRKQAVVEFESARASYELRMQAFDEIERIKGDDNLTSQSIRDWLNGQLDGCWESVLITWQFDEKMSKVYRGSLDLLPRYQP